RVARGQFLNCCLYSAHGGFEAETHAGILHVEQHLVAVLGGESLHDLDAAAMTMHVAEAARVHEDVEAELLSGAEAAQHFVILTAMPQAEVDDLAPIPLARNLQRLPHLPVGKVAVFVE